MRELGKDGEGQRVYRVTIDGAPHFIVAPSFEAALRTVRAWTLAEPDWGDCTDVDVDAIIDSIEPLTRYDSAVILSNEAEQALQVSA